MSSDSLIEVPPIDGELRLAQSGASWSELLVRGLHRADDAVAVIDGDRVLDYRQLCELVGRYIAAFERHGIGAGDGVALLAFNSTDLLAAMFAAQISDIRYTPLHPLGGIDDHLAIIDDAEVSAVLACPRHFGHHVTSLQARAGSTRLLTLGPCDVGGTIDFVSAAEAESPAELRPSRDGDGIVSILYTGGTTGRPKGVVMSDRAYIAHSTAQLAEFGWPERPVTLLSTPLSHASWHFVLPTINRAGALVLHPKFDATQFIVDVDRYKVNATWLVPTMIYAILDCPELDRHDVSSLEMVLYGGSPIPIARLSEALRRIGPAFTQIYGQTETTTICRLAHHDHDVDRPELLASCGLPIFGVSLAVLDDDGNEVPPGELGEISVRSASVMEGYWRRPDLTAERLAGGWKRTGDIGRVDAAGYVYLHERKEDMIVTGGFNVYPSEVEDRLAAHPSVAMAAVVGVPDDRWGEAVTAMVVRRLGHDQVTPGELQEWVRQSMGPLGTPKRVAFASDLPLTPIGKVDRRGVRARFASAVSQ